MSLRYIIDGYNLLNHQVLINYRKNNANSPAKAIQLFIQASRLTGNSKNKVTIVFDGYPGRNADGMEDASVAILYSCDISADEKIKRMVEKSLHRKSLVVVSDDKEIKLLVKALGACAMGIEDFSGSKEQARAKVRKEKEPVKTELSFSQMDKINQELSKLWLK